MRRRAWLMVPLLAGCAGAVPPPPKGAAPRHFRLDGRWKIQSTTLPMWHDPDVTCPELVYLPAMTADHVDDFVVYQNGGQRAVIAGKDFQDPEDNRHVTWRGRGALFLFSSEWYVRAKTDDWMVIYFQATAVSPEGIDILSRAPRLTKAQWTAAQSAIAADPVIAPFRPRLKRLDRRDCSD